MEAIVFIQTPATAAYIKALDDDVRKVQTLIFMIKSLDRQTYVV